MFLLKLDQYFLHLETKEELEIITNLLYILTGYSTQKELAQGLNIKQSFISDAERRFCIPVEWLYIALERTLIGETKTWYPIKYTKGKWFVSPNNDNIIYHCTAEDDVEVLTVKIFYEIYTGNVADTILISFAPELLHHINLTYTFLEQCNDNLYAKYLRKRIQCLLREIWLKVQKGNN